MLGLEKWFVKKPIEKWTVLDDCNAPTLRLDGGPWIIGGAALEFVQTRDFENSRDIDYFFRSYSQYARYVEQFKKVKGAKYEGGWQSVYRDKNCEITIGKHKFNLIGFGFAATPKIISDSFDFTVCQVWTDGRIYECSEKTKYDIEHKVLSFTETQQRAQIMRSVEKTDPIFDIADRTSLRGLETRIKKYRDKGFNPDEAMVEFILRYL